MIPGIVAGQRSPAQIIQGLFAQGQQGFWLPFTDFASLSQDSAGTLPYTALEQPVGRVLDRSGRGNNASQVTSTARGVVSARVNLLQSTNSFLGVGWAGGAGIVVTPAAVLSPLGGMADAVEMTATGSELRQLLQIVPSIVGTSYAGRVLIKAASPADVGKVILMRHAAGSGYLTITLSADWAWVGRSEAAFSSTTHFSLAHRPALGSTDGVIGFHIAAAELKLASQTTLPYQRVNTSADYDSVGFPKYARLDGADDFYTCNGGGSTTGFYYSDVVRPMGGGLRVFFSDRNFGAKGFEAAVNADNKVILTGGNGSAYSGPTSTDSVPNGALTHVAVWDDQTNLCIQINGGAVITAARPAIVGGAAAVKLGKALENANYFKGQVTEPIYRAGPPPSAYERGVIRAYQMQKAGML